MCAHNIYINVNCQQNEDPDLLIETYTLDMKNTASPT
jgi:hypothetical protein